MTNIVRIKFPGAYYHIINRGLHKDDIYFRQRDKVHFCKLLGEMSEKHKVQVHAYCLMDNHFHLTVSTPEANISEAIHFLESAYVNRINREVEREGPFFQGRFLAILVDSDEYLTHLSRYIHLNPVSARIVDKAEQYVWSSYGAYLGLVEAPYWLYRESVMECFNDNPDRYQEFVEAHQLEVLRIFFSKKKTPLILGSEQFRQRIERFVRTLPKKARDPLLVYLKVRYSLAQIAAVVCKVMGVEVEVFQKVSSRNKNIPRLIFIYICKEKSGLCNTVIAKYLNVKSGQAMAKAVERMKQLMASNRLVKDQLEVCLTELAALEPYNMQEIFEPDES